MPLILAIEPDRRQANQLNAVVKGRLHADLVLADSAERALAALGDRVPDLILTSALLSPTDEVVLGDRLRKLNGVAAHVQTLTIPMLAGPRQKVRARAGGMLSALRRGKSQDDATPDGCDPTVFAAQCAEYLERAVAEQAINAAAVAKQNDFVAEALDIQREKAPSFVVKETSPEVETIREFEAIEEPVRVTEPVVSSEPAAFTRSTNPFMADPVPTDPFAAEKFVAAPPPAEPLASETFTGETFATAPIAEPVYAAEQPVEAETPRQSFDTPPESFQPRKREPMAPVFIDAPAAAATVFEAIAQIEAYVAREALASETIGRLEANEIEGNEVDETNWEAASRGVDEDDTEEAPVPEGFIELDLSTLLEDPQVDTPKRGDDDEQAVLRSSQFESDDEPFVFDINEFNEFLVAASKPAVKTQSPLMVQAASEPSIEMIAPQKAEKIAPKPQKIEKVEIESPAVEAPAPAAVRTSNPLLTPSRLGVSQLWPTMDGVVAEPPALNVYKDGRAAVVARTSAKRANGRHKPVQDEWGFFDPEQCGFAALLAKLDEIIDTDDRSA
jgi:hypothetical protein